VNAKALIMDLARRFECEDEAAHDLWSWLPSEHFAKRGHGDYACNHQPSNAMLMREAGLVFSILRGYTDGLDSPEYLDAFKCPCEECPDITREELEAFFAEMKK
jgi:hypothetical protein